MKQQSAPTSSARRTPSRFIVRPVVRPSSPATAPPSSRRKPSGTERDSTRTTAHSSSAAQALLEEDFAEMRELAAATQQAARAEGQPCLARFRALVLDVSYRPVLIVSWQRAITLSLFQKADVLETYSKTVRSSTQAFQIPAVLRVPVYISPDSSGRIALNRKNIITRDGSQCQYCGLRSGSLTIDHVMPQSRGGKNSWSNLVACCSKCNSAKADRTLAEIGWKLRRKPVEPRPFSTILNLGLDHRDLASLPHEWREYLFANIDMGEYGV